MSDGAFEAQIKHQISTTKSPYDNLQLQFMMTEPGWGKEIPEGLYQKLQEFKGEPYKNSQGKTVIDAQPLWDLLGFYTRDVRLGNLQQADVFYCEHYLDLASDCLRQGFIRSFLSALSRAITKLEVSQSRDGFYRKRTSTVTSEQIKQEPVKIKKDILGREKQQ